jgi:hypothetical protein
LADDLEWNNKQKCLWIREKIPPWLKNRISGYTGVDFDSFPNHILTVVNNSVRQQQPDKGRYKKEEAKTLPNKLGAFEICSKTGHAKENSHFRFKNNNKMIKQNSSDQYGGAQGTGKEQRRRVWLWRLKDYTESKDNGSQHKVEKWINTGTVSETSDLQL